MNKSALFDAAIIIKYSWENRHRDENNTVILFVQANKKWPVSLFF